MKLRTYNGKLKTRKDLEDILQEHLPAKAKVIFAIKKQKSIPLDTGADAFEDNLLAFFESNHIFIGVHSLRRWLPDEITGVLSSGPWMTAKETRINPVTALAGLRDERVHWPDTWANLKEALHEVFAKMVEMEKEWTPEPAVHEQVLASERFAPRKN